MRFGGLYGRIGGICDMKTSDKHLSLVVDLYGCPNRCRHCWLGHMPNRRMEEGADEWIFQYFEPFFENITFYSWLREPDFCENYRERWERDRHLSRELRPGALNWEASGA